MGGHDVDLIERGNCTFTPVGDEYIYVKMSLFYIYYIMKYAVGKCVHVFSFYPHKYGGCSVHFSINLSGCSVPIHFIQCNENICVW
jgi:hypothetical protein